LFLSNNSWPYRRISASIQPEYRKIFDGIRQKINFSKDNSSCVMGKLYGKWEFADSQKDADRIRVSGDLGK